MSPYTHRQSVASVPQVMMFNNSFDNTAELNKYQLAYRIVTDNSVALTSCGEADLAHEAVYSGTDTSFFHGLPLNFPSANDYILTNAEPRRSSALVLASTPRGSNGAEHMSLDELSLGIMSQAKGSKSNNSNTYADNINCSNPSMLFSTSSPPSSLPIYSHPAPPISASTSALISTTATGSSSSSSMDYMMTNQNYLLAQPELHHQQYLQQQHQQHHHQQQEQQEQQEQEEQQHQYQQHLPQTSPAASPGDSYTHYPTPSFAAFPSDEFQGVACSNNSAYTANTTAPWNIGIATSTTGQMSSIPANTTTDVAWANESVGTANMMHMQCIAGAAAQTKSHVNNSEDSASHAVQRLHHQQKHRQQGHIQRTKQARPQQLLIMTSLESGTDSMYPYSTGHVIDTNAGGNHSSNMAHTSTVGPGQQYPWSLASSSSPVESCFTSGSSTPSFASLSPSLSYSNSELSTSSASSCDSSRPTSPSFNQSSTLYDGYLSERRLHKLDTDSCSNSPSSLIIRSRKSSTSSTSSTLSQRRMSTLRESTTSMPTSPSVVTSTSSPTHQCPKCLQCFAGPAVLVRHIESIHDKLLWNCVGCKSNLSRRDAVTRHINLSPMDSICRTVGTIGQIKMINGTEIHYEISSYRAKPLDEVMSRMGKKISTALKREIDMVKARDGGATTPGLTGDMMSHSGTVQGYEFEENMMSRLDQDALAIQMEVHELGEEYGEDEDGLKKRRRASQPDLEQRKK